MCCFLAARMAAYVVVGCIMLDGSQCIDGARIEGWQAVNSGELRALYQIDAHRCKEKESGTFLACGLEADERDACLLQRATRRHVMTGDVTVVLLHSRELRVR